MNIGIFYFVFKSQFIIEVLSRQKCFCILPSSIIANSSHKKRALLHWFGLLFLQINFLADSIIIMCTHHDAILKLQLHTLENWISWTLNLVMKMKKLYLVFQFSNWISTLNDIVFNNIIWNYINIFILFSLVFALFDIYIYFLLPTP